MSNEDCDPGQPNHTENEESQLYDSFQKHPMTSMQNLRDHAQELQMDLTKKMNAELKEVFDSFLKKVEDQELNRMSNGQANRESKTRRKDGDLPEKKFVARRSVLSELFEVSHIQTIYHIFAAILILFSLNTIVYDLIDSGRFNLDFEIIIWGFGRFHHVITIWLIMQMCTMLIIYPCFHYWQIIRSPIPPYWWDYVCMSLFLFYQCAVIVLPVKFIIDYELRPASTLVVVAEQVRLLMKVHSFVRENSVRIIRYQSRKKDDDETMEVPSPGFSQYIYFLFAPTLIYRDHYPRTQRINWNYVFTNFAQVLACLFYTYYIFERFCYPVFRNFNHEHVTSKRLILSVFGSMMPGTLILLIGFFGLLHSWFNAFAEMLRFADRLFYRDWWNSKSFSNFYRTWNGVVHDWLYSYIYRDCSKLLGPCYRPMSLGCVFIISATFHEYIITLTLGFFYPVLFIMFGLFGFIVMFVTDKASSRNWNVFLWTSLFMGNGLLMCLYSMEYYARQNCPITNATFLDYLIPRSWTCDFANLNTPINSTPAAVS